MCYLSEASATKQASFSMPRWNWFQIINMVTVKEMKDLFKKELTPINNTLQELSSNFDGLKDSVKFLSDKYDDLLRELHSMNEKHDLQSKNLKKAREELNEAKQHAAEAKQQAEELAQ